MGRIALLFAYQIASIATLVFLTFFDAYVYNWWNWLIAIPVNIFLSEIWPIYWLILRPLFGH
jgi:hypothetical protein